MYLETMAVILCSAPSLALAVVVVELLIIFTYLILEAVVAVQDRQMLHQELHLVRQETLLQLHLVKVIMAELASAQVVAIITVEAVVAQVQ
jgi:hypothetical protein